MKSHYSRDVTNKNILKTFKIFYEILHGPSSRISCVYIRANVQNHNRLTIRIRNSSSREILV